MLSGFFNINKPKNVTSAYVVSKIRKALNQKKVGHTGTLDPNATGVLPICVGKATKLSDYVMKMGKTYIADVVIGFKTDTLDIDGNILETSKLPIYSEELKSAMTIMLKNYIGEIEQIPPIYSALKVNGKKLYEYARKGETVDIKPRYVNIYNLELLGVETKNGCLCSFKLLCSCSKGTYIRTLCDNICSDLGLLGTLKELNRIKSGPFCIEDSIDLDDLLNVPDLSKFLFPLEVGVPEIDKIILKNRDIFRARNGLDIILKENKEFNNYEEIAVYEISGKFIGFGDIFVNGDKKILHIHNLVDY